VTTLIPNPTPYDPVNGADSMVCEGTSGTTDPHFMEQVTSATGYFKTAVKHPTTSAISIDGNSLPSGRSRPLGPSNILDEGGSGNARAGSLLHDGTPSMSSGPTPEEVRGGRRGSSHRPQRCSGHTRRIAGPGLGP